MNKFCTKITTDRNAIRLESNADGIILLKFTPQDCTPSGNYFAFIKNGVIWATNMKKMIMNLLAKEGISFSCERVPNPSFVEKRMAGAYTA